MKHGADDHKNIVVDLSMSEFIKKLTRKEKKQVVSGEQEERNHEMRELQKPVSVITSKRSRRVSAFTIKKRSEMWDL